MEARRRVGGASVLAAIGIAVAGCGSSGNGSGRHTAASAPTKSSTATGLPAGWHVARTTFGATLPYPPGWRQVHGDSGTASAALLGPDGTIRAYLNATPADPNEHIAGWARFRVNHNADEEHHRVRLISSQAGVTIGSERGSCVIDQYATTRTTYRELACLVTPPGGGARTVLVAATQPSAWAQEHSTLMFALNHFAS